MEATKEQEPTTILPDKILPPRLEDAGLEDCALPPDSIKEAFLKAATAVNSRTTTTTDEEEEETPNYTKNGDDVEEREGCVDGLKGLKIKEKVKNGEEKPILS